MYRSFLPRKPYKHLSSLRSRLNLGSKRGFWGSHKPTTDKKKSKSRANHKKDFTSAQSKPKTAPTDSEKVGVVTSQPIKSTRMQLPSMVPFFGSRPWGTLPFDMSSNLFERDALSPMWGGWGPDSINRMFDLSDDAFDTFDPAMDVRDDDKNIYVTAELPGVDKENLKVRIDQETDPECPTLILSGNKTKDVEMKGENLLREERSYAAFKRVLRLPLNILGDEVKAKFKNGVLEVTVPKSEKSIEEKKDTRKEPGLIVNIE
jgi:HSP20 family molecular chaperone IbpA